jgi:hypothetical protein
MKPIDYAAYTREATKVTVFCLVMTGFFALLGAWNNTLATVFCMAAMSFAATFSVEKKQLVHVALGCSVVSASIVLGGIVGHYYSTLGAPLTILYAGLAFYLPKTKILTNIFVTGSVMFLVFTALPFDGKVAVDYVFDGAILTGCFVIYHGLFEYEKRFKKDEASEFKRLTAGIAVISLLIAWGTSYYLQQRYPSLSHLYWIALTVLVVIQSSQQKIIETSLKRILVNVFGALIIVFLFSYIIPEGFFINFALLVIFLFFIFFLGFSYVGRTLFIELFVLGFTHLIGDYQTVIALDRVILTIIGGGIVMLVASVSCSLARRVAR